jgi:hypothetical protein
MTDPTKEEEARYIQGEQLKLAKKVAIEIARECSGATLLKLSEFFDMLIQEASE